MRNTVVFDESGNTGSDLLNAEQPTFTLASCDYNLDEARQLLRIVMQSGAMEAKVSRLKKTNSGRKKLLEFMRDSLVSEERVKAYILHKRYMAVSKIVDQIIENMMYLSGQDLYRDGTNIALSNLYFYCTPVFCGEEQFNAMLLAFTDMMKLRTDEAIDEFKATVHALRGACANNDYDQMLSILTPDNRFFHDMLAGNDTTALDPAVPAFFMHCTAWGMHYTDNFKILHDTSKPIAHRKEILEKMMDTSGPYEIIGYDQRKIEFPLRTDHIHFEDSIDDPRIQVADLVSGVINHWARGKASDEYWDDLCEELEKLNLERFLIGAVWPNPNIDFREYSSLSEGEINPVDAITDYIFNTPKRI